MGNQPKKIRLPRIQTPFEQPSNRSDEIVLQHLDDVLRDLESVKLESAGFNLSGAVAGDLLVANSTAIFVPSKSLPGTGYTVSGFLTVAGDLGTSGILNVGSSGSISGDLKIAQNCTISGTAVASTVLNVSGMVNAASGMIVTGQVSMLSDVFIPQGKLGIGGYFNPSYPLDIYQPETNCVALRISGGVDATSDNVQMRFAGRKDGELWAIGGDIEQGGATKSFEVYSIEFGRSAIRCLGGTVGNMAVHVHDNLTVSGNAVVDSSLTVSGNGAVVGNLNVSGEVIAATAALGTASGLVIDATGQYAFDGKAIGHPQTYTTSNVTPDRSYDANSTTIDEIADVLGTLIADLQAKGILR